MQMQTKFESENNFIARNYRDMTYKEISKHLGLSHGTVCSRVIRLRKKGKIGSKEQIVDWAGAEGKEVKSKIIPKFEFAEGDKYKHYILRTHQGSKQLHLRTETCTILQDCEKHVTVQYKDYKVCILKADLMLGLEKLERVM